MTNNAPWSGENPQGLPDLRGPGASSGQPGPGAPPPGLPGRPAAGYGANASTGQPVPSPDGYGYGGTAPVCPRHPDRVSYVRCQRCNRPVCPECQRQAAVGVQCVDCVKSQQKESRGYRTVFGAQVRTGPPLVTYTLIGVCILVYIVQMALGWSAFTVDYAFVPVLAEQQPYRFLTTAFLHSQSSIVHILFNMMALWTVGRILEPAIGRIKFLLLFLISAVGGSVGYLLFAGGLDSEAFFTPVVGASGAVFGLFGAIFLALKSTGRDVAAILGTLAINLVLGFVIPGLAWQAHLGGLVTGLALGAVYIYAPAKHRTALSIAGSIAIPVLLVVAAVVKYSAVGLL